MGGTSRCSPRQQGEGKRNAEGRHHGWKVEGKGCRGPAKQDPVEVSRYRWSLQCEEEITPFSPLSSAARKRAPHLRLGPRTQKGTGIKIQVWIAGLGPGILLREGEPLSLGGRHPVCAHRVLFIGAKGIISPHSPPQPSVPPLDTRWCFA